MASDPSVFLYLHHLHHLIPYSVLILFNLPPEFLLRSLYTRICFQCGGHTWHCSRRNHLTKGIIALLLLLLLLCASIVLLYRCLHSPVLPTCLCRIPVVLVVNIWCRRQVFDACKCLCMLVVVFLEMTCVGGGDGDDGVSYFPSY